MIVHWVSVAVHDEHTLQIALDKCRRNQSCNRHRSWLSILIKSHSRQVKRTNRRVHLVPSVCSNTSVRPHTSKVAHLVVSIVAINVFPNFLLFHIANSIRSIRSIRGPLSNPPQGRDSPAGSVAVCGLTRSGPPAPSPPRACPSARPASRSLSSRRRPSCRCTG